MKEETKIRGHYDLTEETVQNSLRHYERLFALHDVDGILAGFAPDVLVRFSSQPPFRGTDRLRALLQQRFESMPDYRLVKKLEFLRPPRFAASWTAEWTDAATGMPMAGFGIEFLTVTEGLFTEWFASFSTWRKSESIEINSPENRRILP